MQMLKHVRDRQVEVKLGTPAPHLDESAVERAAAEQRRIGLQRFEISADRNGLRNHGAIVEHKRRDALHRVNRSIGVGALLQFTEIDLLGWNLDSLFGEEYANPARIWGAASVEELHGD